MRLQRGIWLLSVTIFNCASSVIGDEALPSTRHDVFQVDLSVLPTLRCITPVTKDGRVVQLACNDVKQDPSGLYTVDENDKKYLVVDNNDGTIDTMRTVQVPDKDRNIFYVLDAAKDAALSAASFDSSGKLQLSTVARKPILYEPPAVRLTPQEYSVLLHTCTVPLPEVLTDATVKTISADDKGGMQLHCVFPKSHRTVVYNILEDKEMGLFTIEEDGRAFVIETKNGYPVAVRNMVRNNFMEKPVVYSADDNGLLCVAFYREDIKGVYLMPVEKYPWNVTPRMVSVMPQEYAIYTTACTVPLPEQFGVSTHKTITTNAYGKLALRSVNPVTQKVFMNELYWTPDNKILVFETYGILYLLVGTETNEIRVSIAVRVVHGEQVLVLALNETGILCMAWYDSQSVLHLIPVIKQPGYNGLRTRAITIPPQVHLAYDLQFSGEIPPQFAETSAKMVISDAYGKINLTCIHPNTKQEFPYTLIYIMQLGVYYIEDTSTKYIVMDLNNHLSIQKAIMYVFDNYTTIFTKDNIGNLCTAAYDVTLDAVMLTEVGRQKMDCTNKLLVLDEFDYNNRFNICNKSLSEQFADTTDKLIITDSLGHLALITKYKKAEYKYPTDVELTTGFLNFLYKDKQYLLIVTRETLKVRIVYINVYKDQTAVFTVNEDQQLCVASYDCQNNVIFMPVFQITKKT